MIKARELRVGNLLIWNPKLSDEKTTLLPMRVEVVSIHGDEIGYLSPRVEHRAEPFEDDVLPLDAPHRPLIEFEPIALTIEMAEACGFVQKQAADGYRLHNYRLRFEAGNVVFEKQAAGGQPQSVHNVQYLHQLQNLYFASTGEELSVDL